MRQGKLGGRRASPLPVAAAKASHQMPAALRLAGAAEPTSATLCRYGINNSVAQIGIKELRRLTHVRRTVVKGREHKYG